jgi:soluble lytic murein transglycosylase-like protein
MDNFTATLLVIIYYVVIIIMVCTYVAGMEAPEPDVTTAYATESTIIEITDETTTPETIVEAFTTAVETMEEIPETTVEEAVETDPEPEMTAEVRLYYDVPLSTDLQDHIFRVCEEYEVDPAVVISIISRESRFKSDAMGDGGESYGLMQIKKKWHVERMKRLGVTDLLDPYQNVTVGIDLLAELLHYGDSLEWALMCYNGGYSYADKRIKSGNISDYAKGVISMSNSLELKPLG